MDDSGNLVTKEELSEIMSDKIFESVKEGTKEGMQSIFGPQSSAWTGTPYTG